MYPPSLARFGGEGEPLYIGSYTIYIRQEKFQDGAACNYFVYGLKETAVQTESK